MTDRPLHAHADSPSPVAPLHTGVLIFPFALALLARLLLAGQSLWYDELYSLLNVLTGPWSEVVGGAYSPNNHILYSLLTKALISVTGDNSPLVLRMVSILAGSCIGIAVAWPLWQRSRGVAVIIACAVGLHPWLIDISIEARGYSLMLLACVVATHLLPDKPARVAWGYVLAMVVAVYTVPIAGLVLAGHGVAMLAWRRKAIASWLLSAGLVLVVAVLLYLPFLNGIREYAAGAHAPSLPYAVFMAHLPGYALLGYVPQKGGLGLVVVLALMVLLAIRLTEKERAFHPMVATFVTASALGIALPVKLAAAGEVRFMVWLIPPVAIGLVMLLTLLASFLVAIFIRRSRAIMVVLPILLMAYVAVTFHRLSSRPAQPIRDGIEAARVLAKPGEPILGVYMASLEASKVYTLDGFAYDLEQFRQIEPASGRPALAVVFYPAFLARDRADLASYLAENYRVVSNLPGRVSPVVVYARKEPAPTSAPVKP